MNITIEEAWFILEEQNFKCALTNKKLILSKIWTKNQNASLDRINSKKGYIKDNVQWIHKDINKAKMNFDQDYFIQLCKEVTKYQNHK